MKKRFYGIAFSVLMVAGLLAVARVSYGGKLVKIEDRSQVCMLKNRAVGQPLMPVQVDGQTYYGCCEMCTGALKKDGNERYATDPVTGNRVDKARAVIGVRSTGKVLYFENEATFQEYSR